MSPFEIEAVKFQPVSLAKASHAPVRAGRMLDGSTVLVVRDLATAMDYAEHKMNMLLQSTATRAAVCGCQVVRDQGTGMRVRVVVAADANLLLTHIEANRAVARSWGMPATMGERDSMCTEKLPVYRCGPFTIGDKTWPAIDVPAIRRAPGGPVLIRAKEFVRALGMTRAGASSRLLACLEPSKTYVPGEGPPPYFHALATERQTVAFGLPQRRGEAAGKATSVWPLEQSALLFEALAITRRRGRPGEHGEHHATASARASGKYPGVQAPPPQLVSGPDLLAPEAEELVDAV